MGRVSRTGRGSSRARSGPHRGAGRDVGCAILTVSDTRGPATDRSGALIQRLLVASGQRVVSRAWVKDDPPAIRRAVRAALRSPRTDVIVVTGGTGVSRRDSTPEALEPLIEKSLPGFGELFRVLSFRQVGAAAWLSRAEAGIAQGRLVVMLPGSVEAVRLAMSRLLIHELGHVARMLGRSQSKE